MNGHFQVKRAKYKNLHNSKLPVLGGNALLFGVTMPEVTLSVTSYF